MISVLKIPLVLAVALVSSAIHAQTTERTVNARLVYFSPAAEDPQELFIASGKEGEFITCRPSSSVAPAPVSCPVETSGKVVFLKAAGGRDVMASATVPSGVNQAVFFFLKNPNPVGKAAPYQVLVVDESIRALPRGGGYFCNIAPRNVRVSLGEFNYELSPGKSVHVKRPKTDDYNMAPFRVFMKNNEDWMPVKDSGMRFSETERYFLISYLENGTRPSVKVYKQLMTGGRSPSR